ncbi:MAG: hypothetical protein ACXQS5_00210 [Candidatus Methanospirareceae archaeon]
MLIGIVSCNEGDERDILPSKEDVESSSETSNPQESSETSNHQEGSDYDADVFIESYEEEVERLEKMEDRELDNQIDRYYKVLRYSAGNTKKDKAKSLMSLCEEASRKDKKRVIRSLIRAGRGILVREIFLFDCKLKDKYMREWAKTTDLKNNQHLVKLIKYLDNELELAREIVASKEFATGARCFAARTLGKKGGREDIKLLKSHYNEINPQRVEYMLKGKRFYGPVPGYGRSKIDDCAKVGVRWIERRLSR